MSEQVAQLLQAVEGLKTSQDSLSKRLDDLSTTSATRNAGPFIRTGESALTSRGFQFSRLFGVLTGKLSKDHAKVEIDLSNRLQDEYAARGLYSKAEANSILVPFASELLSQLDPQLTQFAAEISEVTRAGAGPGIDRDQLAYERSKYYGISIQKALSWQDNLQGGALVGPPTYGELIDLLRNREVFLRAGASVLPLPATGRIVYPRQTGAATGYWVGESTTVTESNQTTGDMVLQAKKLGVLVTVPNELFRFATIAAEQFVREDIVRVAALTMDDALLEAVGSATQPKGLINYAGITTHVASTTGANGDTFEPEDVLKMIAKVEEKNAQFGAWVMRPLMYAAIGNRRADAVSAGDKKGGFLFNMLRDLAGQNTNTSQDSPGGLEGYPVHKSIQVSNARVKSSGTDLTYVLGGNFKDYVLAMSGAMEFLLSTQGNDYFKQDQTAIRGILFCDGAPRHEGSFVFCDDLVMA